MTNMTETDSLPNLHQRGLDTKQESSQTIPIVRGTKGLSPRSAPEESMDNVRQPTSMRAPLARANPDNETNGVNDQISTGDQVHVSSFTGPNTVSTAGAPQPKVVQTAFIHKLYNMLEDQSIQHLISWSNTAESFVMSPSNDFSKVLSQYFKHTNISSFVRQLNMYGFHKVSDVFHTGSPESPLWEFKHGNGNFKRGDLVGLREIKRRASRHALVHRDSYSGPKPPLPQPGPSTEPISSHQIPAHESTESRLTSLEQTAYEIQSHLQQSEGNANLMQARNQVILETLSRSLQINHELSRVILSTIPNSNITIHRDGETLWFSRSFTNTEKVVNIQAELQKQVEIIRSLDEHSEPQQIASRPFLSTISLENGSLSPRQLPQEDSRRGPATNLNSRNNYYHRPPIPSLFSAASHTINSNIFHPSPSSLRSQLPGNIPLSQPLPNSAPHLSPPTNIPRRHTSADIRNVHGWQPNLQALGSGQSKSQWPSSPRCGPTSINEEQRIRESFSSYSLATASSHLRTEDSRPTTPPTYNSASVNLGNNYPRAPGKEKPGSTHKDAPGPQIRRGNMAHILNPTESTDRHEDHTENPREDDRKRKRID